MEVGAGVDVCTDDDDVFGDVWSGHGMLCSSCSGPKARERLYGSM